VFLAILQALGQELVFRTGVGNFQVNIIFPYPCLA